MVVIFPNRNACWPKECVVRSSEALSACIACRCCVRRRQGKYALLSVPLLLCRPPAVFLLLAVQVGRAVVFILFIVDTRENFQPIWVALIDSRVAPIFVCHARRLTSQSEPLFRMPRLCVLSWYPTPACVLRSLGYHFAMLRSDTSLLSVFTWLRLLRVVNVFLSQVRVLMVFIWKTKFILIGASFHDVHQSSHSMENYPSMHFRLGQSLYVAARHIFRRKMYTRTSAI